MKNIFNLICVNYSVITPIYLWVAGCLGYTYDLFG
jgi:hypothetical protein